MVPRDVMKLLFETVTPSKRIEGRVTVSYEFNKR